MFEKFSAVLQVLYDKIRAIATVLYDELRAINTVLTTLLLNAGQVHNGTIFPAKILKKGLKWYTWVYIIHNGIVSTGLKYEQFVSGDIQSALYKNLPLHGNGEFAH